MGIIQRDCVDWNQTELFRAICSWVVLSRLYDCTGGRANKDWNTWRSGDSAVRRGIWHESDGARRLAVLAMMQSVVVVEFYMRIYWRWSSVLEVQNVDYDICLGFMRNWKIFLEYLDGTEVDSPRILKSWRKIWNRNMKHNTSTTLRVWVGCSSVALNIYPPADSLILDWQGS